jgi:hypothetical protein
MKLGDRQSLMAVACTLTLMAAAMPRMAARVIE